MPRFYSASSGAFFDTRIHGARTKLVDDPDLVRPQIEIDDPTAPEDQLTKPKIKVDDMSAAAPQIEVPNESCLLPADAVEISDELHRALLDAQSAGQMIVAGDDGLPVAQDRPGPTDAELSARRIADIDAELATVDTSGARPSREVALALLAGKTPDPATVEKLQALESQAVILRSERAALVAV